MSDILNVKDPMRPCSVKRLFNLTFYSMISRPLDVISEVVIIGA